MNPQIVVVVAVTIFNKDIVANLKTDAIAVVIACLHLT